MKVYLSLYLVVAQIRWWSCDAGRLARATLCGGLPPRPRFMSVVGTCASVPMRFR